MITLRFESIPKEQLGLALLLALMSSILVHWQVLPEEGPQANKPPSDIPAEVIRKTDEFLARYWKSGGGFGHTSLALINREIGPLGDPALRYLVWRRKPHSKTDVDAHKAGVIVRLLGIRMIPFLLEAIDGLPPVGKLSSLKICRTSHSEEGAGSPIYREIIIAYIALLDEKEWYTGPAPEPPGDFRLRVCDSAYFDLTEFIRPPGVNLVQHMFEPPDRAKYREALNKAIAELKRWCKEHEKEINERFPSYKDDPFFKKPENK